MKRWLISMVLLAACGGSSDTPPPTLASSAPLEGEQGVAPSSKLALVFSEAMAKDSLSVTSSPTVVLGSPDWQNDKTVVFSPQGGWAPNTEYSLSIAAKDLVGNVLSSPKTLRFKTASANTNAAPGVPTGLQAASADGAVNLSWTANLEPDLAGYTLYWGTASTALDGVVFVDKAQTSQGIQGLNNGTPYFFALEALDTGGNRSAKSAAVQGTPRDSVPPILVSSEPPHQSSGLSAVSKIRLSFSEPIKASSFSLSALRCPGTDPATCLKVTPPVFSYEWNAERTVVDARPSTNFFTGGYTYILNLAASDASDNPLSGSKSFYFDVQAEADTSKPAVLRSENTLSLEQNTASVLFVFNEPMDQASVQAAFSSQPALGCSWTWQGNQATCRVTSGLLQLTTHRLVIGTGAKDTAGNTLAAAYETNLAVGDFNPRVISYSPSSRFGSALNVPIASPIVLTFSEPMNRSLTAAAFSVEVMGSGVKTGSIAWNETSTQLTFTPSSPYGYASTVVWKLGTGAKDAGPQSKALTAEVSASFGTVAILR